MLCRDTAMVCSVSFLFYTFYVVITEKNSTDEKYRTGEKLDFLKDWLGNVDLYQSVLNKIMTILK